MKNLIFVFLVIGATMIFFSCQEDSVIAPVSDQSDQVPVSLAKKPAPNLIGTMYTDFTFTPPTYWNGTVDFGTTGTYSITFFSYDPPRQYSNASPFKEDFIIYELNSDWQDSKNVYLKGWAKGVTTFANNPLDPAKFVSNGKIEEAYGPLEMWDDRNVHSSGNIHWEAQGVPDYGDGTFRIN
jgi:hypothetical protein